MSGEDKEEDESDCGCDEDMEERSKRGLLDLWKGRRR
jgi:hypothetical protein